MKKGKILLNKESIQKYTDTFRDFVNKMFKMAEMPVIEIPQKTTSILSNLRK